jgi:hypothetical protein
MPIKITNQSSGLSYKGSKAFGQLYYKLKEYPRKAKVAVAFGQYEAMQTVMLDAKDRAPKDTHAMEMSGYVAKPKVTTHTASVESGFGGKSERYVVGIHEGFFKVVTGEHFFFRNALDAGRDLIRKTVARWVQHYLRYGKLKALPAKQVPESPWEQSP